MARSVFVSFLLVITVRGGGATYGVSFATTRSQQLAEGDRTLSIGGGPVNLGRASGPAGGCSFLQFGVGVGGMGSVRLERARDRTDRVHPAAHDGDERIAKSKKDHASPHRQGRDAFNTSARAFLHNQDPQRKSRLPAIGAMPF